MASTDPQPHAAGAATITSELAGAELRTGDRVAGRYRIERMLGIGGMGVVYLAHDDQLDVAVALKVLRPEFAKRNDAMERFRQEILLARQVSSPHVLRIHDLVSDDGRWFISMDYVDGESLEQRIEREGRLAPDQALAILRQIALGLSAAHARGVIHRDLKPANILLDRDGAAYISDFGVARSAGRSGLTGSGVVIGTPEYLSPEQARAEPVDGRSDLYALGLILYEMLVAQLPFTGGTAAEHLAQRMVRDPPSLGIARPDLPPWVVHLCDRLLQRRVSRRLQSADEVVRAIDAKRVPRMPGRVPMWIALAALAALVALAPWWLPALRARYAEPVKQASGEAQPVQLAVLPVIGDNAPLASAMTWIIASTLNEADADSAAPERVARTMRQLGYDAAAARRFGARVADTVPARELLVGDLTADAAGNVSLNLQRLAPDGVEVRWQHRESGSALSALRSSLAALRPGIAADAIAIPDDAALLALGTALVALDGTDEEAAAQALARAQSAAPDFIALQRLQLQWLDGHGRGTAATALAEDAISRFGAAPATAPARILVGIASVLAGDPEHALTLLDQAGSQRDPSLARWRARAQADSGELSAALATLAEATMADPADPDSWFLRGKYSILYGEPQRGVDDFLLRAQVLYTRLGSIRGRADTINALGIGYDRLGRGDDAVEQFRLAARLRQSLGDAIGSATTLRNLSTVLAVQGKFDEAQAALAEARKLLEAEGDNRTLSDVINSQGVLEEERGNLRGALDAYRQALSLRRDVGDPRRSGESLLNVGFCYYQMGQFDDAQAYLQQAAQEYERVDDIAGRVRALQSLGLLATARGDWEAARSSLEETWHTSEERQLVEETGVSLAYLAELDRLQGRLGEALQHARQSADTFTARDDVRGATEARLIEGATLIDAGAWAQAKTVFDAVAKTAAENQEQQARLNLERARLHLAQGDAAAAEAAATQAQGDAKTAHSRALELAATGVRLAARSAGGSTIAIAEIDALELAAKELGQVPVQLVIDEVALNVTAGAAVRRYRDATARAQRPGGYGRAYVIHAYAARALQGTDAGAAERARIKARDVATLVGLALPAELRAGFETNLDSLLKHASSP